MYGQGITRGKAAILGIDATLNQACAAILINGCIDAHFLLHFLKYSYERIRNLGHGANQKNLNAALVKSIVIPIPEFHEQKDILTTLNACDTKIAALENEALLLYELFRAMLEELMTGRLSTIYLIE
jgi:type I restriction enzyme, S subunit